MGYEFTVSPEEEAELPLKLANKFVLSPLFDRLDVPGFLQSLGEHEGVAFPDPLNDQIQRFARRLEISQAFQSRMAGIRHEGEQEKECMHHDE